MLTKRALMIYNPSSGKKRNHKNFPLIVEKLTDMGYEISIFQLQEDAQELSSLIKRACRQQWEALFVAGGDGTIQNVLQSLSPELYRPKVGVFPFGTSNEFAQVIGLPHNVFKILSIIEKGNTAYVDIGKLGQQYFANIAAAGWLTDITYETPKKLKSYLGEFAYALCFIKKLFQQRSREKIAIQIFPDTYISDLSFFLIMNGNSVGPFEQFIPQTNESDGAFHLVTCNIRNRLHLFTVLLITALRVGNPSSLIKHQKISSSEVHLPENMFVNMDGERKTVLERKFQVLPNHLKVFTVEAE
ncbi:diacylglycerol kinase (ATP) [Geomicrobium halophilum]|uniref:Diacylglycerol kinase (ATP) n=1 Tax=Geomicrobium halophilum TaxID=549000 RepID=A0A841PPH7_9BACL|nr:YegS/Rv2252/BmrU family lipid kinase [Geomicrobium halophilum]MBB6449106.1 diacylglycerol kinase (ATP) [Geomicrobium halophilum]